MCSLCSLFQRVMPESLIFFLVIPVLLQPVVVLMSFMRLMQLRYRYPSYELQSSKTISADLRQVLQPTIEQLQASGFKPCAAYRVKKLLHLDSADDRGIFLYHPQTQCFVEVELRYPIDSLDPTNVVFYNVLKEPVPGQRQPKHTWLVTMNGIAHNVLGSIPNTQLEDIYHPTLIGQWEHHQTKLAQLLAVKSPTNLTPEKFVVALQAIQHQYIDGLLATRSLLPSAQGYFLSWRAALSLAIKIRINVGLSNRRQTAIQQAHKQKIIPPLSIPISIQMDSFLRMRELETNRRSLRLGKWILLVSLGLFVVMALAMPQSFGAFRLSDLYSLVAVLFLHEAGHFLAMKAFGYRDTTMFFLPMFGAAVTGKKEDASLSEKVWVLLAGPLPGMVLGFGLMAAIRFYPELGWLDHTAVMMVGLNLINLLPVYPLDGGKIAHHLLFSRYPFTDVVFKSLTVLLFGLLGWVSPMLLGLAIVTAMSIPTSYRTAKLNQTIQQHLQDNPQDNPLELIFRQMAAAGYHKLPFLRREAIVKELLERRNENQASLKSRLGLAGIYSLSLLVGIGGMIVTLMLPKSADILAAKASSNPPAFQQELTEPDTE
jgi:Zn-dependent protease